MRSKNSAAGERRHGTGRGTLRPIDPGRTRDQGGFTLVELLIALVLTSVMFSAMLVVFRTQTRINTVETDVIEAQQNARVAMTALGQDIRQAGYFVDQFNRQPIWLDAAPYQLIFNANLSNGFVAMHRDSAVPLSDGTLYRPGDFSSLPQEENLPAFLDRYLNESETIRLTLDRTYDGLVTTADRQQGAANPNLFTLTKEINGNPPAILAYNVRGPRPYPDGTMPPPLFEYWGTFTTPDQLELWGDTSGDGRLSAAEAAALTPMPVNLLPEIRQVDVTVIVETNRPDLHFEGTGSTASQNYPYRSYVLRQRIRARNVGINPTGLILCGERPTSPRNPIGYDTPYDQGGSITIEWDSSTDEYTGEDDVQYYTIYRQIGGGDFEVVAQLQAMGVDTTYVLEDDGDIDNFNAPIDGEPYYYFVAAWDCAPQESIPSAVIGPIVSLPNGPAPPEITDAWDTACDAGQDITVQFTRSAQDDGTGTGVSWYLIYRGTLADSTIVTKVMTDSVAATGAATYHYHDNIGNEAGQPPVDGTPYWYIARALQGSVPSDNSNEYGAVWSGAGLSAPRLLAVDDKPADDGTALILTWRRSASEDCSPPPTTYRIYRRVQGMTGWTTVTEVPITFTMYYQYEDDNGGAGLINGTTYEYMVEVRTTGVAEESNILDGTPRDNPPVSPPEHLVAVDVPCESDGDIRITWQRSPDDHAGAYTADAYFLYRKVDGGIYSQIQTFTATGATSYAWTDADSTNPGYAPVLGFTYWYKVTAYDYDTSSESGPSNEDDAISDGSPGAPEITAAYDTYGAGSRQIRVEFTASPDDGGCADSVTRYHIYRTTTPGAYGSYIGTVTATNAASYQWDDNMTNSVAPPLDGFIYYYMIRAYDAVNVDESLDSNEFGPVEPYGASCECCPIFVDDMETGNLGWTHGGSRDDWELGTPRGDSFDPSLAHSGSRVWGTDLGAGSADGQYRSRADSYLISPTLDFSAFEEGYITMSFYRWLSVEVSNKDQAQIRVNNGSGWQVVWQNSQNDNTVDTEWKLQYVDLSQWVMGSVAVRIAFTLTSNRSAQFGGWNLDDVEICYTAPGPCDYFFYVGDSIAESQGNNLFFDITNGHDASITMLGMELSWSSETSLLKAIRTQGPGSVGAVWDVSTAQPSAVEAIFTTVIPFNAGQTIQFKLEFAPGHMRGSAMTIKFITACGTSTEVVVQVPE